MEASRVRNIAIIMALVIATAIALGFLIHSIKNLHFLKTQVGPAVDRVETTGKELEKIRKEVGSEIAKLEATPLDQEKPAETLKRLDRLIELYKYDEELVLAGEQLLAATEILIEAAKKDSRESLALALQLLESVEQAISLTRGRLDKTKKSANIWRTFFFSPEISRRILLSQLPKV